LVENTLFEDLSDDSSRLQRGECQACVRYTNVIAWNRIA